ncbi:MAG: response regulator [Gammaproteobacteria bacterium]|nr:response regulator [Gammaproteobacteria bacterium]
MNANDLLSSAISVVLIDDHALFRAGVEELLTRRGITVAASVNNGREGIVRVRELQPDVVLLDIRLPQEGGLDILAQLRREFPSLAVVMLTTSRDDADIATALQHGAQGYLLKDMEPEELIIALQAIMRRETVVAPALASSLARVVQGGRKKSTDRLAELTAREREILRLIADGGSNKVIGRILGITDGTVKLHVKSILRKLEVHSRVEAAVIAVEQGLSQKGNVDR